MQRDLQGRGGGPRDGGRARRRARSPASRGSAGYAWVIRPPSTLMAISVSPLAAGPLILAPSAMANVELCAGQVATPSFGAVTFTPLCGQAALYALNVPATGCTIRT